MGAAASGERIARLAAVLGAGRAAGELGAFSAEVEGGELGALAVLALEVEGGELGAVAAAGFFRWKRETRDISPSASGRISL